MIDTTTRTLDGGLDIGAFLAISPDGGTLYVRRGSQLAAVKAATGETTGTLPMPVGAHQFLFSPQGWPAFIIGRDVTVVDSNTLKIISSFAACYPVAAALTPDGRLLLVKTPDYSSDCARSDPVEPHFMSVGRRDRPPGVALYLRQAQTGRTELMGCNLPGWRARAHVGNSGSEDEFISCSYDSSCAIDVIPLRGRPYEEAGTLKVGSLAAEGAAVSADGKKLSLFSRSDQSGLATVDLESGAVDSFAIPQVAQIALPPAPHDRPPRAGTIQEDRMLKSAHLAFGFATRRLPPRRNTRSQR